MEIERKWILKEIPHDYKIVSHAFIEQFYVSTEPEVRLRKRINGDIASFKLCIKSNGTLSREEIETEIPEFFYEDVKLFVNRPPITKDYYVFNCEGYKMEVSAVEGKFIYCEVEFDSEEQAKDYILPIVDAIEVTDDPNYKMKNYWKNTR